MVTAFCAVALRMVELNGRGREKNEGITMRSRNWGTKGQREEWTR